MSPPFTPKVTEDPEKEEDMIDAVEYNGWRFGVDDESFMIKIGTQACGGIVVEM